MSADAPAETSDGKLWVPRPANVCQAGAIDARLRLPPWLVCGGVVGGVGEALPVGVFCLHCGACTAVGVRDAVAGAMVVVVVKEGEDHGLDFPPREGPGEVVVDW